MACSTFFKFFCFNPRYDIFQSAKKGEIMSFNMTSLQVDLNEAAKFVDIMSLTLLASLSAIAYSYTKYKMVTIFGLTCEDSSTSL